MIFLNLIVGNENKTKTRTNWFWNHGSLKNKSNHMEVLRISALRVLNSKTTRGLSSRQDSSICQKWKNRRIRMSTRLWCLKSQLVDRSASHVAGMITIARNSSCKVVLIVFTCTTMSKTSKAAFSFTATSSFKRSKSSQCIRLYSTTTMKKNKSWK